MEIKCIKCQKDIQEGQEVRTSKGFVCPACANEIKKKKRYTVAGAISVVAIAAVVGGLALSSQQTYNGFDGVGNINDSINVSVYNADSLNYIEGLIAARDTVSGSKPIDNIESFNSQFLNNIKSSKDNSSSAVVIPSISALFEINTNYFANNGKELIKEFAKAYIKTNKIANILIEGYTCDLGGDKMNTTLSQLRTEAAKNVLEAAGVPSDRIETKWYGKSRYNEFSYSDKSEYRRVTISIK